MMGAIRGSETALLMSRDAPSLERLRRLHDVHPALDDDCVKCQTCTSGTQERGKAEAFRPRQVQSNQHTAKMCFVETSARQPRSSGRTSANETQKPSAVIPQAFSSGCAKTCLPSPWTPRLVVVVCDTPIDSEHELRSSTNSIGHPDLAAENADVWTSVRWQGDVDNACPPSHLA